MLVEESTKQTFITVTNLRPHRNYTFTVYTKSGDNGSSWNSISLPMSASFSTRESVPEKVNACSNFFGVTCFIYVFQHPRFPHLDLLKYSQVKLDLNGLYLAMTKTVCLLDLPYHTVYWYDNDCIVFKKKCNWFTSNIWQGSTSTITREFPPGSSSGTISGLFPGKTYLFRIQAKTKIGSGNSTKWEQVMPIWGEKSLDNRICLVKSIALIQLSYLIHLAPPKPSKKDVPEVLAKTTTSVKLQFKKGLFSDENGQVYHWDYSPLACTVYIIIYAYIL